MQGAEFRRAVFRRAFCNTPGVFTALAVPSRFSEIRVSKRGEDADCVNLSVAASATDFIARLALNPAIRPPRARRRPRLHRDMYTRSGSGDQHPLAVIASHRPKIANRVDAEGYCFWLLSDQLI